MMSIRNNGLYRPRWLQKLYAACFGYFWRPCPMCGREFGGHEWGRWGYAAMPISPSRGIAVCPYCADDARAMLAEWQRYLDWTGYAKSGGE